MDAYPSERLIVTIDGPAGTGKSTVARHLARRLGVDFLDTGAMYRAATALAIDAGFDLEDADQVAELVRGADLCFVWQDDPPTLLANGRSIMHRLRDPDVGSHVSPVSALAPVRRVLVERQRRIGEVHARLVSEGRDQGSVVFFDADVMFYRDADIAVRARRRADQLRASGREADLGAVQREVRERDERDSTREVGPLVCPDDAVRVDTSDLSQDQVVDRLVSLVRERVGESVG